MTQCLSCKTFNEPNAAFCSQCGTALPRRAGVVADADALEARTRGRSRPAVSSPVSLPPAGRGRGVAFLLIALAFVGLVAVAIALRSGDEGAEDVQSLVTRPDGQADEITDAPDRVGGAAVPDPSPEAEILVAREEERSPVLTPTDASRVIVVIDLYDPEGQSLRQTRGVFVHADGVILCRYRPLMGATKAMARVAQRDRSSPSSVSIEGLSYSDEVNDLALLRVRSSEVSFPRLRVRTTGVAVGDELSLHDRRRGSTVKVVNTSYVAPDGVRRIDLGPQPRIQSDPFVAIDDRGRLAGLCVFEHEGEVLTEFAVPPRERRFLLDEVPVLEGVLSLPTNATFEQLFEATYMGTFEDLMQKGRRAATAKEWEDAIVHFVNALDRVAIEEIGEADAAEANDRLRESYFRRVEILFRAKRDREVAALLEEALGRFEDDAVMWRLLGQSRLAVDLIAAGIEALLNARELEPTKELDHLLEDSYLQLSRDAADAQDGAASELTLVEGIENVPESAILRIELARLYVEFEAWDDAMALLRQAKEYDRSQAEIVDALLDRIDDALRRRDAVIIPISSANSLKTTATLDQRTEFDFIIDTGATFTAIPHALATQLGYDLRRAERTRVRTANGIIETPLIRMRSVDLGGYSVRNLRVLVLPESAGTRSGLLGLNFLNHFKFSVDAARREFRLERQ